MKAIFIFGILGLMLIGAANFNFFIERHETIHKSIFWNHGVDSHIDYSPEIEGVVVLAATIPHGKCLYECETMSLAHDLNEIIGQYVMFLFILIMSLATLFFVIFMIILYRLKSILEEEKSEEHEKTKIHIS